MKAIGWAFVLALVVVVLVVAAMTWLAWSLCRISKRETPEP